MCQARKRAFMTHLLFLSAYTFFFDEDIALEMNTVWKK